MLTRTAATEQLRNLGVREGDALLVHASMRAVGPVEGGADGLIDALLEVVGPAGTVMAPAFGLEGYAPRGSVPGQQVAPPEERASRASVGILAERLCLRPDAHRSAHPCVAFAAVGANAAFLTDKAPFHFPLGPGSPLARLQQLDGVILLLGVGQEANSSIHLAEVLADVPYASRSALVRDEDGNVREMRGSPECSAGFGKIEPVLRQARILKEGTLGAAPACRMRARALVSMASAMLQGQPDILLCDDPSCRWCVPARALCGPATPLPRRSES